MAGVFVELSLAGFAERDVLEWPLDKFYLLQKAASQGKRRERAYFVQDVSVAIMSAFGGKGLADYIKVLIEEDD